MTRACSDCGTPISGRSSGRCRSCSITAANRSLEGRTASRDVALRRHSVQPGEGRFASSPASVAKRNDAISGIADLTISRAAAEHGSTNLLRAIIRMAVRHGSTPPGLSVERTWELAREFSVA